MNEEIEAIEKNKTWEITGLAKNYGKLINVNM
jgi:hypothetical protein